MGRTPLQGCSAMELPDGTVVPVRDYDGNLLMDQAQWEAYSAQMLQNVGRGIELLLRAHPERRAAFGIAEGQTHAVLSLRDILGISKTPGNAKDGGTRGDG